MRRCATCSACRGAIVADLLMQLFGLASIALVLPIAVWGWRLATHRALDRERLRLLALGRRRRARRRLRRLPAAQRGLAAAGRARRRRRRRAAALRRSGVAGNDVLGVARLIVGVAAGVGAAVALALTLGFGWRRAVEAEAPRRAGARQRRRRGSRDAEDDDEDEPRRWISLGWLAHGFLSLKARLAPLVRAPHDPTRHVREPSPDRTGGRVEPRFDDYQTALRRARDGGRADERRAKTRTRTPGAARPRKPARRAEAAAPSGGYELPPLDLLAAPKAERTHHAEPATSIQDNATALEGVLQRFRRARRDHQRAAGPGGHALRARAGARHQVVARDRARRRHRPLDERAVRARRRGLRPQRHRHRAAQSDAREGLSARAARRPTTTTTRRPSCRSASARPSAASR